MSDSIRNDIMGKVELARADIDAFNGQVARYGRGLVPEPVFLENRLRHGVYGQRQEDVHMMRSKQPLGLITPDQLDAMADITEHYSAGIAHLTTRQDIQIHYIKLTETPEVMALFAKASGTFREACGNVVRNITAPPVSGVWPNEVFDVTPHGIALAQFLLKHPDGQGLGRKFKIQISGTDDARWNQSMIHDIGATARVRDGERGFHILVGGGLGAVPHPAKLLYDFIPESELLPLSLAILRVFGEHGEKRKRARARLKFLVAKLGIDEFKRLVEVERSKLPSDPRWIDEQFNAKDDVALSPPGATWDEPKNADDAHWLRTNVFRQSQDGYATVKVRVLQGDLTPNQLRGIAKIGREISGDTIRIGVDQSIVIRYVPTDRLLEMRRRLNELDLGTAGAGGLGDTVTCPGADTCKLGITTPRSVARELQPIIEQHKLDPRISTLRIHVSGCPNSCSQRQIADIGLFGASKTVEGVPAPHFVLLLGGVPDGRGPGKRPGDGFGATVLKLPARKVPAAIEFLLGHFLEESDDHESFTNWVHRVGILEFKKLLKPFTLMESPYLKPDLYQEFGKDKPFGVRRGVGECAGDIVEPVDLLLADADERAEATAVAFHEGLALDSIVNRARETFQIAAQALLTVDRAHDPNVEDTADRFRNDWYDCGRIPEGVGHTFFPAISENVDDISPDRLRRLVEESGLFVEEVHSIVGKVRGQALLAAAGGLK